MSTTLLVILSLAALLVGPMLALVWSRGRAWRAVIDGLSLSLVGGICFLVVFPHAIEVAGPIGFIAIIPGMLMPGWAHRLGEHWERTFVYAGMALLAVHAAIDGAALTLPSTSMGVAVIAHRLPMGLAVYSAASRTAAGQRAGFTAVGILIASTLVGVAIGEPMSGIGGPIGHGAFEGFVGGLLLHIVFEHAPVFPAPEHPDLLGQGPRPDRHRSDRDHGHHHPSARQAARIGGNRWSATGAFLGMLIVAGLIASQSDDPHAHHAGVSFMETLWTLTLNTAPWLLGAYLLATAAHRFSGAPIPLSAAGNPLLQGFRGVYFGVPQPLCASGVIPMAERQLVGGSTPSAVTAFLVAAPSVGLPAFVLSAGLLGGSITFIRFGALVAIALLAGLLVQRLQAGDRDRDTPQLHPASTWHRSAGFGLGELVDHTLPWVVLGILMGGLGVVTLPGLQMASWPPVVQIPVFTLLSAPLFVSATGVTPTLVALLDHGLSPGAAAAMLLAGPALNLPVITLLHRHFGSIASWMVAVLVLGGAMIMGGVVEALHWVPSPLVQSAPDNVLHPVSVIILVLLAARSTLRQGARGVLAQIIEPIEEWDMSEEEAHHEVEDQKHPLAGSQNPDQP